MNETRRSQIVWLLEHRNDHLPVESRSASPVASAGFAHGTLAPAVCPMCEGVDSLGCPECGGRGEVELWRERDPYAKNETVGYDRTRHDATVARDRQIEIMGQQTRPPRKEAELLKEANDRGYGWEEERAAMYRRYDFAHIDRALDTLRQWDVDAAHALNAVYVDGWLAEVGEITPIVEKHCRRGIARIGVLLPPQLRTGVAVHPAEARVLARMSSGRVATMTAPASAEAVRGSAPASAAAYPETDAA